MSSQKSLYTYYTPKLGANNSCSLSHELEESPYDLREILGGESEKTTQILKNLYHIIEIISYKHSIDWIGIYQKRKNINGDFVLVKLAYIGEPSRAEFPLNEKFAKTSNNSMVGLLGTEIIVENISDYKGPYYQCDAKVKSEFCSAILGKNKNIIGIIDAESFQKNFFKKEILKDLRELCLNITENNLPS